MKKDRERRLPLPRVDVITVALGVVALIFVAAFGGKALQGYRLQRHNAALREHVEELEAETSELEDLLAYAQGPEYAEKVAREQYKWTKPGEKLIIPVFEETGAGAAEPSQSEPGSGLGSDEGPPFWAEWWRLLLGPFD
jgi:cell division protein FtsB